MALATIAFWLLVVFVVYNVYRYLTLRWAVNVPYVSTLWPVLYTLPSAFSARFDFYAEMNRRSQELKSAFAFYVPLLGQPWIFIRSLEDSKYILSDEFEHFPKGELAEHIRIFMGRGIFASDGEQWQFQRKSASHLFKVRELKLMSQVFQQHLPDLSAYFARNEGRPVDLQTVFANFTFDSFSEIAFGINFDSLNRPSDFCAAFNRAQLLTANRILFPAYKMLGRAWPPEVQLRAAMDHLHRTTAAILEDYRRDQKEELSESRRQSLLGRFFGENLTDSEIRENILNFLLAGRDTTAITLTFAIYYLFRAGPELVARVREECDRVLGPQQPVTFESHQKLKLVEAVMDETMRLAPPVPIDPKFATRDVRLPSGTVVRRGMAAVWSAYIMGRHEELWDCPEEFRPDRFLDPVAHNGGIPINGANLPFQFGPRRCLGERMAYLEVISVLVHIVREYDFDVSPQSFVMEPSVTLYASNGVWATPRPRRQ